MIRNLKTLGLALMAVLALGAVVASAASAQQGTLTADGPVTLVGEETGGVTANRLTAFGAFVHCPESTYTGHKHITTPHVAIPTPATTATITPHYKQTTGTGAPNCTGPLGATATVDMNGCDYVVYIGVTTGTGNTYGAKFEIVCPALQEITVTLWTTEALHTANPGKPDCKLHVPPQGDLTGAHVTDTTVGDGHIEINGTIEKITVNETLPAHEPASAFCDNKHTTLGKFDIDVTIEDKNKTPLSLSHP